MSSSSVASEPDGGYLSFSGRISRKVYWLHYFLPLTALSFVGLGIDMAADTQFVEVVVFLLILVPNIASGVKRSHDRDRTGWFLLIGLIPIIGGLWLLIELGFLRGTPGPNRFGKNPLAGSAGLQPLAA